VGVIKNIIPLLGMVTLAGGFTKITTFPSEKNANNSLSVARTSTSILLSMDWFKGKSTGNHRFSH
jgi:hypothetical protein